MKKSSHPELVSGADANRQMLKQIQHDMLRDSVELFGIESFKSFPLSNYNFKN